MSHDGCQSWLKCKIVHVSGVLHTLHQEAEYTANSTRRGGLIPSGTTHAKGKESASLLLTLEGKCPQNMLNKCSVGFFLLKFCIMHNWINRQLNKIQAKHVTFVLSTCWFFKPYFCTRYHNHGLNPRILARLVSTFLKQHRINPSTISTTCWSVA